MKRFLAFICVLALVVSMCSVFSFAAEPEPDIAVPQEGTRTGGVHYVVRTATHMYVSPNPNSGYVFQGYIPVGAHLVRVNNSGDDIGWYKMQYGSYVGYIRANCLTEVQ